MCLEFRKEDRLEDKFKSYLVMSEIDSQTENKLMVAGGEG